MRVPDDMIRKTSEKKNSSDGFWTIVFGVFVGNILTILFVTLFAVVMALIGINVISSGLDHQFKSPRMMQNR